MTQGTWPQRLPQSGPDTFLTTGRLPARTHLRPNPTPECWRPGYHPLGRRHTEASLGNVTNANIYSQVPQADIQSDHPTAWTRHQRAARTASESRRQLDEYPLMENWTFFFCNKLILCCTSQSQSIMGLQWGTHTKGITYQFPSTTCKVLPFRDHRPFLSLASGKQQLRDGMESGSHRPAPSPVPALHSCITWPSHLNIKRKKSGGYFYSGEEDP